MFNYEEAERRLRLGAIGIRRKSWKYKCLFLWNNYMTKIPEPQIFDESRAELWDLSDEDKNSNDWIDPSE